MYKFLDWRYKIHADYLYTEISLKLPNKLFPPNYIAQCYSLDLKHLTKGMWVF